MSKMDSTNISATIGSVQVISLYFLDKVVELPGTEVIDEVSVQVSVQMSCSYHLYVIFVTC